MVESNHKDIRISLEPRDEDDIAVMEGRLPASDQPEDRHSAKAILHGVESEPEEAEDVTEPEPRGGNVVTFPNRQPWMKMAAALMIGMMVTTVVNTRLQVGDNGAGGDLRVASANVAILEVYRGADDTDLPVVRITDDPWITLIAYPDFTDAESLQVYIERESTGGEEWDLVLEQTVGVGTRDSLVLSVPSRDLTRGVHRLRIESDVGDRRISGTNLKFSVE